MTHLEHDTGIRARQWRTSQRIRSAVDSEGPLRMQMNYLIAFLGGAIIALILSMKSTRRSMQRQRDILAHGILAQGRVVDLWQPPLAGASTRVYFEFYPSGAAYPIRTCHIDRRGHGEWLASLPQVGTEVAVRYLPSSPTRAVIVKLVARFTN
jgi:hypothetical protein